MRYAMKKVMLGAAVCCALLLCSHVVAQEDSAEQAITQLAFAAFEGRLDDVKKMLDEHPEIINERLNFDKIHMLDWLHPVISSGVYSSATPLYYAVAEGREGVVELLLKRRRIQIDKGTEYEPPLYAAIENGHIEIAKRLITTGATLFPEEASWTIFFEAVQSNNINSVRYVVGLLRKFKGQNEKFDLSEYMLRGDHEGDTALHVLAKKGNKKTMEIAQYLLEQGLADINKTNNEGKRPFELLPEDAMPGFSELLTGKHNGERKLVEQRTVLEALACCDLKELSLLAR